ncbi:MAG: T9SS type A sorting domain-containing protein, partial [Thermoanaerobaculia bacterium]|nr:T9SS type A sorting domain-containing protein [Thermoanaerobaculia bacterium]
VGATGSSAIALKYNASGVQQWKTSSFPLYNPIKPETKYHIDLNSFNNIIIAIDDPEAIGNYELWELNALNGNLIIVYNMPFIQSFWGTPNGMALDANGNIYVLSTQDGASRIRMAHFKHNSTGAAWSALINANAGERVSGIDIRLDADLNIYLLVKYYSSNKYNYFVAKYNSSGSQLWNKIYSSTGTDNIPVAFALNGVKNPDVFVTGYSSKGDIVTVGYDTDGNPLWDAVVYDCGNNGPDVAAAMVIDVCNNLYITGNSNCNNTFRDYKTLKYSAAAPPTITSDGLTTICPGSSVTLNSSEASGYLWNTGDTTQSIIVSTAGTYTVTVTNADGCQAVSAPTTVVVSPIPLAAINPATTDICQGSSTVLSVNTCTGCSYLWSTGHTTPSITVSPAFTTNYTVTVTNAGPCSAVSVPATVTVNPAPIVTATSNLAAICIGKSANFMANGAASYNWHPAVGISNPAIPNPVASPLVTTTYTVTGTMNGCSGTATVTISVLSPPGQPDVIAGPADLCSGSANNIYSIATVAGATSYAWTLPPGWTGISTTNSITATAGASGGNITVTAINECGNSAPRTLIVSVITAPAQPENILGPTTVCPGTANIFSVPPVAGATSYSWAFPASDWIGSSASNSILTTAGEKNVVIYVSANNNCGSSPIQTLTVTVNPTPTVNFGMDTVVLQSGQPLVPNVSGEGLKFMWSTKETTATILVDSMQMYSVTVTNNVECTDSASVYVIIVTTSGNLNEIHNLFISPNPTNDFLKIRCEESPVRWIEIIDALGKTIVRDEIPIEKGEERIINLELLAPGIYYLQLTGTKFTATVPIIKL